MKKNQIRAVVLLGVGSVALLLAAVWYAVTFNDARLVEPMDFSQYVFRVQDLPMICATSLFVLYVLSLAAVLIRAVVRNRRTLREGKYTRSISPKLGFLGFFGFLGFLGFWSYGARNDVSPFLFFIFFGFFGFFYEGKMSHTLRDERFRENSVRAQATAARVALTLIALSLVLLVRGPLLGSLDHTLIALVVLQSLAVALALFLSEYLLYRYDHDEPEESGE